jgi:hypothetical protein
MLDLYILLQQFKTVPCVWDFIFSLNTGELRMGLDYIYSKCSA